VSDPGRELLELGRSALDPSPAKRAELRARIEAAVAAGAGAPAPRGWGAGYLLGGVAIAGLAGALVWYAASELSSERASEPVAPARPVLDTSAPDAPSSRLDPPAVTDPPRAPSPPPPSELAPSAPRERAPRAPHAGGAPTDSLAAELAIVTAARRALAQGDGQQASAALARHAREFPEGALTEERKALEVLALCATGQQSRAIAAARAFVARYPRSVASSSVRASCAGPSLSPASP
jgi:hypothetical protein